MDELHSQQGHKEAWRPKVMSSVISRDMPRTTQAARTALPSFFPDNLLP